MTTSDSDSNILTNPGTVAFKTGSVLLFLKSLIDDRTTKRKRSFLDSLKRIGPKIDHCWTPEVVVLS